jgi:predicted anti-sigma-YlaC factor YlaD
MNALFDSRFDCSAARALLSGRVDRADADQPALDAHLATCAECRAELAALRAGASILREGRAVRAPANLWARIDSTVRAGETRELAPASRSPQLVRFAAALLGAASVLAAAKALEAACEPASTPIAVAPPLEQEAFAAQMHALVPTLGAARASAEGDTFLARAPERLLLARYLESGGESR